MWDMLIVNRMNRDDNLKGCSLFRFFTIGSGSATLGYCYRYCPSLLAYGLSLLFIIIILFLNHHEEIPNHVIITTVQKDVMWWASILSIHPLGIFLIIIWHIIILLSSQFFSPMINMSLFIVLCYRYGLQLPENGSSSTFLYAILFYFSYLLSFTHFAWGHALFQLQHYTISVCFSYYFTEFDFLFREKKLLLPCFTYF